MTLGFKTILGNKPTDFVNKIWRGFFEHDHILRDDVSAVNYFIITYSRNLIHFEWKNQPAKIHTIRADETDRWQVGTPIHFVIGNRTKERFQFAPLLPCLATEPIKIVRSNEAALVYVSGYLLNTDEVIALARNDGFEGIIDFFDYFNQDFEGKIIHWTPFLYKNSLKQYINKFVL